MSGQKNKMMSFKIAFVLINLVFVISVITVSLNFDGIFRFFQERHVDNVIEEIDTILEDEEYEVLLGKFVIDNDVELIVTENETLVYSSNGLGEVMYADTLYTHGYVYKSIYESGDYLIWLVVYETSVVNYSNFILLSLFMLMILYIIVITLTLYVFFKKVSLPLLQLSHLINKAKTCEEFSKDEDLDAIAYELITVFNEINFTLLSSRKQYDDISKLYDSQKSYITEQNNHLKTTLHDIKNPLSAIRNSCYLLLQSHEFSEKSELMLKNIEKSSDITHDYIVNTLNTVIENMSDIYMVEVAINVKDVIEANFEVSNLYVLNKDLKVVIEGDENFVISNSLKFNQIVSNVIYNAVKYSKDASEIKVELHEDRFTITNTIDRSVSGGQGFGLERVKLICDELDMEIDSKTNNDNYVVTIIY